MALCATCSGFDLCKIFGLPSMALKNRDSGANYIWTGHGEQLCFRHSDDISQVQEAASAGCGLCMLLFDAFKCKEPVAAQDAGKLPIVLAAGGGLVNDWDDTRSSQNTMYEPRLRPFFVHPEKGLISLCNLDLSIDSGMCFPENRTFSLI